jgi:CRP-like cAMP-binding protein
MKIDAAILNHKLFKGIAEGDLPLLFECLNCQTKNFPRHAAVFNEGQTINKLGIVVSGGLHVVSYDFYGNRQIITNINKGEMFGESIALSGIPMPFEISAAQESEVFFINTSKLSSLCRNACGFHNSLINNLLGILAGKNINLTQKITHISAKSVREKILSYLNYISKQKKSKYFDIPFTRQELADYLSVDRSYLSNELSKLREEGLIDFEKNHFKITQ